MVSPLTKAILATLGATFFAVTLTTLTSYSIIPSPGIQVDQSIFAALAGIVIYYILSALASRIVESKLHFTFRKMAIVISFAVVLIALLVVWIQQLSFLAISLGLVAAGISFSLQQPILSLVGWLVLAFERPFSVGDRIEIKDVAGDVIDYGFFFVKVMEIRQWTDADLYTGRILLVPTNWIPSNTIYNYSKDFGYIWDKLWIGLLYDANYTKTANDIREMARQHNQSWNKPPKHTQKLKANTSSKIRRLNLRCSSTLTATGFKSTSDIWRKLKPEPRRTANCLS